MFYLFTLSGIALCAIAVAIVYAVLDVSSEMDELADARRKARE